MRAVGRHAAQLGQGRGLDPGHEADQLVETGEGLIPLDPSRGGALKELLQETNLWEIFEKGGPIMWPIPA